MGATSNSSPPRWTSAASVTRATRTGMAPSLRRSLARSGSSTRPLSRGALAEVEPPVAATHLVAGRVFEVALAQQGETGLAADRVGRRVVHCRERVQEPVAPLGSGDVHDGPGGR